MLKHNEICKQFINKSGGKVIKDIGDAVFASFTSPQTVIQCANNVILSLQNCKKIENKDIRTKIKGVTMIRSSPSLAISAPLAFAIL